MSGSSGSADRLRPLKRKSSGDGDGEAAQYRKVESKSPPPYVPWQIPNFLPRSRLRFFVASPSKQMAVDLYQSEVEEFDEQVLLNLSMASQVNPHMDPSVMWWWDNGDASDAELGVKLFPELPPKAAAAMWGRFVTNAKLCIDHYNQKNQANFVYKHSPDNGFFKVGEQNCTNYYHLNFYAQDKNGHSQLFFGEIEICTHPKVENVTCCSAVSPSDAGGRSIRIIEEALKHVYPNWDTVGMDYEHCYACIPRFKHPKGSCYVAGHFADTRQYLSDVLGSHSSR